jgi:hypothetical protein
MALVSAIIGVVVGIAGTKPANRIFKADVDTAHVVVPTQANP